MSISRITFFIFMLVVVLSVNSYSKSYLDVVEPDVTPPEVTFNQPSTWKTAHKGQPSIQFSGTASDDFGVVSVRWENDAGQSGNCTGAGTWYFKRLVLREGENLVCVTAEDSSGNIGTSSVLILYNPVTSIPSPTVTSITSNMAINNGSVNITNLAGTGFVSGATVRLTRSGKTDINATGVSLQSSTKITCTLPLIGVATGLWNVVVKNPDSQSGTLTNGFTVKAPPPTVTAVTPNTGVNTGPVIVTRLAGTGFVSGATVKLTKAGQADRSATGVTVVSATKITCTLPITGAGIGEWNIVVTNPDAQSGTLANGFTVKASAPTVTAISPNTGVNTGPVIVTNLAGTGFVSGATVKLTKAGQADRSATGVTVVSATKITCTLPITGAGVGAWNIVVTNPDAQSGTLANGFTVKVPPPTVTAISPNTGMNTGPVIVTNLAGTGFVSGATVKLTKTGQTNRSATRVTVASATKITCKLPITGAGVGAWNIVVTNPDAQSGTLANGFTITSLYTLIGSVNLGDYSASSDGVPVTVELRIGTSIQRTINTTLDSVGEFTISGIGPGTYNIGIKPSHWLRKVVPVTVSTIDSSTTSMDVILAEVDVINGDIDGNNKIDYTDVRLLIQQYQKLPLAASNCADLNEDGVVDMSDYGILQKNYWKTGD